MRTSLLSTDLGLTPTRNKGVGVPANALMIGGVPVQINGYFIVIGA